MRFRARVAILVSVVRVSNCRPLRFGSMTCILRPIWASPRDLWPQPVAFCQAIRPHDRRSWRSWRCGRCAPRNRPGWRSSAGDDQFNIRPRNLPERRGGWRAVSGTISDEAAHRTGHPGAQIRPGAGRPNMLGGRQETPNPPRSGSKPICSLRHVLRGFVSPCFSCIQSRPPWTRSPVLSTISVIGPLVGRLFDTICRDCARRRSVGFHAPQQASHNALRSSKRQAERNAQGRAGLDRQIRISLLSAAPPWLWGGPPGDRFFAEPDRDVAALAGGLVILRPVHHPILRLRKFIPTRRVVFKGHPKVLSSKRPTAYASERIGATRSVWGQSASNLIPATRSGGCFRMTHRSRVPAASLRPHAG